MLNKIKMISLGILLLTTHTVFATTNQFLAVSDIHFDPFLACTPNSTSCELIDTLQSVPGITWHDILKKYEPVSQPLLQDTNIDLLDSSLTDIAKRASAEQPKFVLLLGDFLAHNYKTKFMQYSSDKSEAAYEHFVRQTNDFLVSQFINIFPHTDIYMAVGNNDTYEDHYVIDPNGQFFKDMASAWSAGIQDENNHALVQSEFANGGYYTVTPTQDSQLRLIVLNSILFSAKAQGNNIDKQAQDQLTFLQNALQQAQSTNQHVIIALHIPAGIDVYASMSGKTFKMIEFWNKKYTAAFKQLMEQYQAEILGVLASHAHVDWLDKISTKNGMIAMTGIPSISPVNGNLPSYKVYDYNDGSLQNFQTYTFHLTGDKQWSFEYDFNQIYQPNCQNCQLWMGMENLQSTGALADNYKQFFDGGQHSQPIGQQWLPYYYCQTMSITADEYQACLSAHSS